MFDTDLPPSRTEQLQKSNSENTEGRSGSGSIWNLKKQAYHISRAGGVGEILDFRAICDRDGWTCQICGGPVNETLRYPNPRSKSLDHIIPLSRGGAHTEKNVQLAHLVCNMRKGSLVADELEDQGEYVTPGSSKQARSYDEFMHLAKIENPDLYAEVLKRHKVLPHDGRKTKELHSHFQDDELDATHVGAVKRRADREVYRQWMAEQWS